MKNILNLQASSLFQMQFVTKNKKPKIEVIAQMFKINKRHLLVQGKTFEYFH